MTNTAFLNSVVKDSLKLFEYYRKGPIEMSKLRPGFIFQACVDEVFTGRGIVSVENGLGDHCLPEMGLSIQLKTTTQESPPKQIMFCRSSPRGDTAESQKLKRIADVESRIQKMFSDTGTYLFVLLYVNLTHNGVKQYLLHDEAGIVGDWLDVESVCAPVKQTHFMVKTDKMKLWV